MTKIKTFCPYCNKDTLFTEFEESKETNLLGDLISHKYKYAKCDSCNGEVIFPGYLDYFYETLDTNYRIKHNLISRDEIKNFTLINGVTYEKLALIVGDTKENIELYASFKKRPSKEISDKLRELQNVKLLREKLKELENGYLK